MEENNKKLDEIETKRDEMKTILNDIQKALAFYNTVNPQDKRVIIPEIIPEKKDISNVYICVYDENKCDLFKKIDFKINKYNEWLEKKVESSYWYGSIYKGINSNKVGIFRGYCRLGKLYEPKWQEVGEQEKEYIVNCDMKETIGFDELRLIMYTEGKIGPYQLGMASSEEILEVLSYAYNYFELNHLHR